MYHFETMRLGLIQQFFVPRNHQWSFYKVNKEANFRLPSFRCYLDKRILRGVRRTLLTRLHVRKIIKLGRLI